MKPQKGQSLTECALALGLIAALIIVAAASIGQTPAGQAMAAMASEASAALASSPELVVEAVGFSQDRSNSHALERHGPDAEAAYKCFEKYPTPSQMWKNKFTHKTAFVCYDGPNFFLQIVDDLGKEVTAFRRTAAKNLGELGNYLKGMGYAQPQ